MTRLSLSFFFFEQLKSFKIISSKHFTLIFEVNANLRNKKLTLLSKSRNPLIFLCLKYALTQSQPVNACNPVSALLISTS